MTKTTRTKKNAATVADLDVDAINAAALKAEQEAEALAELEAQAEAEMAQAIEDAGPAEEIPDEADEIVPVNHVPGVLKDMIDNVTPEQREQKQKEIAAEYAARRAYENTKPGGLTAGKEAKLAGYEKKMVTPGTAAMFVALDIDPSFINRQLSVRDRFNIYALDKINDLTTALGAGFMKNAFNRAIVMSLFNFRDAGIAFTSEAAHGAACDKIKVDAAIRKHLVRHSVAPSTAPTQQSSTMNALEVMGIVTSNQLRGKAEVYTLTDTPQTRRLEEVLRAA